MSDPLVLVLLGTDVHPFDRLVGWVQRWLADCDGVQPRCVVQHGTSAEPTSPVTGVTFYPHDELQRMVRAADVVVCHGGPATITECRAAGRLPVVVPRDPALGEHVDGHQQRFARMFGRSGLVRLAETEDTLRAALDLAMREPAEFAVSRADVLELTDAPARRVGDVVDGLIAARRQAQERSPGRPGGRALLTRRARAR
ncbi:MAG: glycosyl transferase family 28 [Pseudonocardiales bacterium]|nr:MAG: glycosyl transferase family 28 [Pseudonocardiales bacterium]